MDSNPSAAVSERDAGNDIAAGGEKVSAEELARVGRGGGSLDDFDFDSDASVDKLAALLAKRATDLPVSVHYSHSLVNRGTETVGERWCGGVYGVGCCVVLGVMS